MRICLLVLLTNIVQFGVCITFNRSNSISAEVARGSECRSTVAVVTGCGSGIGKAVAVSLVQNSTYSTVSTEEHHYVSYVVCVGRNMDKLLETTCYINEHYPLPFWCGKSRASAMIVDVSNVHSVNRLIDDIVRSYGTIGILVNSAGVTKDKMFSNMTFDNWKSVIDTNLNGVYYLMTRVLRNMLLSNYGRIVNIASVVGIAGQQGQSNYAASKGGVIGLSKMFAELNKNTGITINVVCPGFTDTPMTYAIPRAIMQSYKNQIPIGRMARTEEIAAAVKYLASPEVSMTSKVITVDGGVTFGYSL